ncbi:unnamed protein product [Heligmosomoides polygyrus]|uniref:Uncharacterized protein n=1 Tax=Heligmosomoides polygyrus TaxID=6339 RepID=A0A183FI17_HELPZ|nr:unnamed protein product [Heligmosomoides polygyrus]
MFSDLDYPRAGVGDVFGTSTARQAHLVDVACERNPSLTYCKNREIRRKEPDPPEDPFEEKFEPVEPSSHQNEKEDISLEFEETTTFRPRRRTTPVPLPRQNHLFTILPTLQNEKDYRR